MSDNSSQLPTVQSNLSSGLQAWEGAELSAPPASTSPLERALAAIRRYKFLVIGVVLLGAAAGVAATHLVTPQYEVRATVWIQSETPLETKTGPIRSAELLNSDAWVELLKSYRVTDSVVREMALYLEPENPQDSPLFTKFSLAEKFVPGPYRLTIDPNRKHWVLASKKFATSDSGAATDSVGRAFGFHWMVPASAFIGTSSRTVDFAVSIPREVAVALRDRLNTKLMPQSSFLQLSLQDPNRRLAAGVLNAWVTEFLSVAGELKKRNLVDVANILNGQLAYAEKSLHDAETALEDFRIHTITLPNEGGPVAAGVQDTRDPALKFFFEQRTEFDNVRNDRESLQKIVDDANKGAVRWESALLIPSVAQSPAAEALRGAFKQEYEAQAALANARLVYKDEYPLVKQMIASLSTLQTQTIPQLVKQILDQLAQREAQYDTRIASESRDLQAIPARTIEEGRLRRQVTVSEGLYTTLKSRYQEAQLAEASAVPDVSVLDSAIAPIAPTKNTKPAIILFAIAAGLGGGLGLALLLDRLDRRIQYPEQVTSDLGLPIAGAVPRLPKGGVDPKSPEQVYQLVEAFRSLRMSVMNSGSLPVSLAVSSPSPADGKSFISSNLAMSFAEGGFKTLLIDGDTRRGNLHDMFSLRRSPGLTDFLAGVADRESIVYSTPHQNLWMIPSGMRRRQSPEFLSSPMLKELIQTLKSEYDVVICDTPPFAAGIDAYAIATAAERLVVVLRIGKTLRRMAAAKMVLLDRLPIEVIGTVLNAVQLDGEFQYYGYVRGYDVEDEQETALLRP